MIRDKLERPLELVNLAAAIGLVVTFGGVAMAGDSLLWYDGFVIDDANALSPNTYLSNVNLHGQDGGSGTFFTGTWQQSNFNPTIGNTRSETNVGTPDDPDFIVHEDTWVVPSSLTRPGQNLPSTGDRSGDYGIGYGGDVCCYTSRTARQFATPFSSVDGTIYMGFLVNFGEGNPADPHYRAVEFWQGADPNFGPGDDFLNMSLGFSSLDNYDDPANGPAGDNHQLSLKVKGVREMFGVVEETNYQLEEHLEYAAQVGETHSIVLKFDLSTDDVELGGAGDSVSVFLDPTLADVVEPTPSLTVSGIDLNLDRMSSIVLFDFSGAVDNPGGFDELRVGRSWSDVAILSVPEPTSLGLSGLAALLGFVLSTRRARCTFELTWNPRSTPTRGSSSG